MIFLIINIEFKKLLKNLAIPLGVGILASLLIRDGVDFFNESVNKPAFSPPAFLFPIAWTILYILMGVAAYIVEISKNKTDNKPFIFYFTQLAVNFLWPLVFFNLKWYFLSIVVIAALLTLVILTFIEFFKINKTAGYLLIPYILWLLFATALNIGVYALN